MKMSKKELKWFIGCWLVFLTLFFAFGEARADDFGISSANVQGYVYEWGGGGSFSVPLTYAQTFQRGSYDILYNTGVFSSTDGSYNLNFSAAEWVGSNAGNINQSLTFLAYPNNTTLLGNGSAYGCATAFFPDCGTYSPPAGVDYIDLGNDFWQQFMQEYDYTQDSAPEASELVTNFMEFYAESVGTSGLEAGLVISFGNYIYDICKNREDYILSVENLIDESRRFFGAVGQGNYASAFSGNASDYHCYFFYDEFTWTANTNAVSLGFSLNVPTSASAKISARRVVSADYNVQIYEGTAPADAVYSAIQNLYSGTMLLYDSSGNQVDLDVDMPEDLTIYTTDPDDLIQLFIDLNAPEDTRGILMDLFYPDLDDIATLSDFEDDLGILYMPFDFLFFATNDIRTTTPQATLYFKEPEWSYKGVQIFQGREFTYDPVQIFGTTFWNTFRYLACFSILFTAAVGTFNHLFNNDKDLS